jgi:hypothetical protein
MKFDTQTAAQYAGEKLDSLLERAIRDSAEIVAKSDIPATVAYFAELRTAVRNLADKLTELQKHVDTLSYETLPTMFVNQNVKTINVDGVGRVTINVRWSGSMIDKSRAFEWLRSTGNGGLIIETVNSQTLGAFAREETALGRPLPDDTFKVSSSPYVSITRS